MTQVHLVLISRGEYGKIICNLMYSDRYLNFSTYHGDSQFTSSLEHLSQQIKTCLCRFCCLHLT